VRLWKAAVLSAFVLGASVSLLADTVTDPLVLFNKGGHGSFDLPATTTVACPVNNSVELECLLTNSSGSPNIINGSGELPPFDIKNTTGKSIIEVDFVIQTTNFDQTFSADIEPDDLTPVFPNADVSVQPPFIFSEIGTVTVKFGNSPRVPNDPTVTSDIPCIGDFCNAGFAPNGEVELEAFFLPKGSTPPGSVFANNQEGNLTLLATPEPGTLALLFSAVGLIAGGRKLFARG
jgi:hypothetical protein